MQDLAVSGGGPVSDLEVGCRGGEDGAPEGQELQEEAEGHQEESSDDSESSGSWRTDLEEPEERSPERWRSTVDMESEGSELEGEKEVEDQMTLQ